MSSVDHKKPATLNQIICSGWKKLALADQSDADEMVKTLREVLEDLESLEAASK